MFFIQKTEKRAPRTFDSCSVVLRRRLEGSSTRFSDYKDEDSFFGSFQSQLYD